MNKVIQLKDQDLLINGNSYNVTGKFWITKENYGEDADGNRGMMIEYVDNWELDTLIKNNEDLAKKELCTLELLEYIEENYNEFI